MRRFLKRTLQLGFVAGVGYAVWRFLDRQREEPGVGWEPQPFPYPPQPRAETDIAATSGTAATTAAAATTTAATAWVEASDGVCPGTHPVKAKLSSKIFHVPGGANYDRTKADRCYRDAAAAEADGLRQSAR